jgi:hypothetical protein
MIMRIVLIFAMSCGMLVSIGCNQPSVSTASVEPVSAPVAPPKHWTVESQTNPMDNVVTQFVVNDESVKVVLCYVNGKPCSNHSVPIYIKGPGHCFIEANVGSTSRRIRVKFDDGKPQIEVWGITDDHSALVPPLHPFRENLMKHKRMMLEFGCDASDSAVVTSNIEGLQELLNPNGSLK